MLTLTGVIATGGDIPKAVRVARLAGATERDIERVME